MGGGEREKARASPLLLIWPFFLFFFLSGGGIRVEETLVIAVSGTASDDRQAKIQRLSSGPD